MSNKKLSNRLEAFRTDRPSEWMMDEFKRDAYAIEKENQALREQVDDLQYANHQQKILIDVMNKTDKRFIAEIEAAAVERAADEEAEGCVHVEGYYCPVEDLKRWAANHRKEAQK